MFTHTSLIFATTLWGRRVTLPHVADEETRGKGGSMTCLLLHTWWVAAQGPKPRYLLTFISAEKAKPPFLYTKSRQRKFK